jgi:hypothetical protein
MAALVIEQDNKDDLLNQDNAANDVELVDEVKSVETLITYFKKTMLFEVPYFALHDFQQCICCLVCYYCDAQKTTSLQSLFWTNKASAILQILSQEVGILTLVRYNQMKHCEVTRSSNSVNQLLFDVYSRPLKLQPKCLPVSGRHIIWFDSSGRFDSGAQYGWGFLQVQHVVMRRRHATPSLSIIESDLTLKKYSQLMNDSHLMNQYVLKHKHIVSRKWMRKIYCVCVLGMFYCIDAPPVQCVLSENCYAAGIERLLRYALQEQQQVAAVKFLFAAACTHF